MKNENIVEKWVLMRHSGYSTGMFELNLGYDETIAKFDTKEQAYSELRKLDNYLELKYKNNYVRMYYIAHIIWDLSDCENECEKLDILSDFSHATNYDCCDFDYLNVWEIS